MVSAHRREPATASVLARGDEFSTQEFVYSTRKTWLLGQVRRLDATGLRSLVSFSDPVCRTRLDGQVVMPDT